MKKRVLSLLMAVTLCFSTVPMTALAQEADATTEQETTVPETSPEPQSDATVYEADNSGEDIQDISGGDIGADSAAQGTAKEKDAAVQAVQALIDALPETVTEDNAESVGAQLEAIAEAMDSLTEEQIAELDMTRLNAISEAMNAPMTVAAQDGTHADHPICGAECTHTDGEKHAVLTWTGISSLSDIKGSGNYYLKQSVELDTVWVCKYADVTLCLNGYTITGADGQLAIEVGKEASLAITDCRTEPGKITHATDATGENNGGIFAGGTLTLWNGIITGNTAGYYGGVYVYGTFIMNGGSITGNTCTLSYSGGGVRVYGTFTMNGGTITGNNGSYSGGVYQSNGTFTMTGGDITGNTGEVGGGVCLDSGTFAMEGGSITRNTGTACGGVYQAGGTFTMSGGDITGNKSTSGYTGGGVHVYGGTFTMDGGKIAENEGPCGGVYVRNGGTFTLNQGIITENKNTYTYSAAGVYVAGTFTMTGGSISKNTNPGKEQSNGGGGVYVSGKFIMTGGEITGNETIGANGSGGVYVHGTFTMTGGSIKGNKSSGGSASSGGVFVGRNCTFNMEEGTIADNENTSGNYSGGGVYIDNGNFTLTGGTISGNTSASNGGGVYLNYGTFTMNGGKITNNKATSGASYGGGGGVYADGTFIMNDGEISGNASASSGGGVYLDSDSFTMTGGKISGNTSASNGGGVYLRGGTVAMTGGAITGNNTTTPENNCGGGVYVNDCYSLTMSGTVRITDNYKNGTLENGVYVRGDNGTDGNVCLGGYNKSITIGAGGLTKEAQIGVNIIGTLLAGGKSIIAKNANDSMLDYTQIFKSDMAGQGYVVTGPKEGTLYLYHVEHQHSWKYELGASGSDILATCTNNTSPCPSPKVYVTISRPKHAVYGDGRSADAKLSSAEGITDAVEVTYKKGNDILPEAPTDAGAYTASITLTSADGEKVTAAVDYTIAKAEPTARNFQFSAPDYLTYDGNAKTANVTAEPGMGGITVKYYQDGAEVQQPTDAGEYTVKINVAESANYKAANGLTGTGWKFTIAANTDAPAVELSGSMAYTGDKITPEVSVKIGGKTLVKDRDYTITYGTNVDAGENAGKVTITAKGNYVFDAVEESFTIEKAEQVLSFTKDNVTKTYIDQDFTNALICTKVDGTVTYASDNTAVAAVDQNTGKTAIVGAGTATITATAAETPNYKKGTASYTLTVDKAAPAGKPKYTLITEGGKTLAAAGLTLNGSTLKPAAGTLEWVNADGNVLSGDTEVKVNTDYWWRFTPTDTNYDSLTGKVELYHVDVPAITAQPKSVSVITGEKAAFEVTATGTDVTYQWKIDRNDGKGFVDINGATGAAYTTGVTDKDCNGFKYQCVIRNATGSVTTDIVTLTVSENIIPTPSPTPIPTPEPSTTPTPEPGTTPTPTPEPGTTPTPTPEPSTTPIPEPGTTPDRNAYKIIDGADSKWTQNTDGTLVIRGDGEITKFQSVKVDGNVIDPSNYTVTEGSTIITLKADYLKTLSEGSHTFELVWTDGSASTNFTVAANTSGKDTKDDDKSDNKDSNGNNESEGNADSSGTGANNNAAAQTKSPKTGDPFGIWLTLFAISLTGLAGMLARRKKQ